MGVQGRVNLENLVSVDLGGKSEKSGVTGFLAGLLEGRWGARWCELCGPGTWRQEAGYVRGEMPGLGPGRDPQLMLGG